MASAPTGALTGAQATRGPAYPPRTADGWGPGFAMAAGIHLMLVAALALGVNWKSQQPEALEAEVWSEIPETAALAPPPPPVVRQAEPEPRAEPPAREAEPEAPRETVPDLVIAPKPKKEPKPPKEKPPREVFEDVKPVKPKKVEPPKPEPKSEPRPKPEPKAEPRKPEPKVMEAKVEAKPAKVDAKADKAKAEADSRATAAALEAQRKANIARMMDSLGGSSLGSSGGTGSRNAGPSAGYGGRIKARVKPNIVFADNVSGNPTAVVEVRCGPDGRILSRKLLSSSGVPAWDEAVLRAVDRTEVLPADTDGRVPPVMEIKFQPNDF
ncbi:cell envelope integrity protein TolA [Aquabacterium sp.]|uniref:cell envelope integrity protein TolA n=1 Tax=Aquabacterium sp. TaxID=1872578 RepID=UPI0025BA2847|nr:cell envelope integrity protein TolA [Aquabacterium sp.]